jgi:hypothetical protein
VVQAVVLAASPLCLRVLIRTRRGFSKGASTGGWTAMVAVVHVAQRAVVACSDRGGGSSMLVQCVMRCPGRCIAKIVKVK